MKAINGEWLGYYVENPEIDGKYGTYAPYFRKIFSIEKTLVKAQLKIAALGWFKAYVNGKEITEDDEFLTSWTDYNKRIEYTYYDITQNLKKENAIGVVLGNGWACGTIVFGNAKKYYNVNNPCFIAEIVLTYADKSVESVITDLSWKANIGEIIYNDIMHGEFIDHRRTLGNFSDATYDDSLWSVPQLRESRSELLMEGKSPRTRVKEILPVRYVHTVNGKRIYTTDQNMAGLIECDICGTAGAKLVFRYGEMLNSDGSVYTGNLRGAEATDTYICKGEGVERFRPLFTFHGFQYIEISIEGVAEVSNILALVIYSDLKKVGDFHCSDELVNKIFSNVCWGQKSNFINLPTDCPQRDERLGWLGDAGIFARTAMYQMDCRDFLAHYLSVIAEAMREDGAIPCIAPCPKGFLDDAIGASGWADQFIAILNDYYDFYKDKRIIEKYFPFAKRFIAWIENNSHNYRRNTYCFSDWLSINSDLKEGYGDVDFQLFDLCFYASDCLCMERFCRLLGIKNSSYSEKYRHAKEYFLAHLIVDGKPIGGGRQTALLISYKAGFLTAEQIRDELVADLDKNGLTCGFIGTKYILPVLTEIGRSDLAYKLITSTDYPSWGYSVANGATTVWERWDSYTKENGFHPSGMNSFNHFAFGSCVEWFYSGILGIRMKEGNHLLCKPVIDDSGRIMSAKGFYNSIFGKIEVEWKIVDDSANKQCILSISIPKKIKAEYDFGQWQIKKVIENKGETLYCLIRNLD